MGNFSELLCLAATMGAALEPLQVRELLLAGITGNGNVRF